MPAVPIRPGRGVAGHALEDQAGRRPSDLLGVLRDDRDRGAPELAPVSVGVVNLQSTSGETTTQYLAAGSTLAVAPAVVLFVVLQRHIVGALTAGAVAT